MGALRGQWERRGGVPVLAEKEVRELGGDLSDVTVSFNRGGNSAEALSSLPFHFVCAHLLVGHEDLLDIPLSEYSEVDLGGGCARLAHRVGGLTFSGAAGTGVYTIGEDLRRGQEAELARTRREAGQRALAARGHNADLDGDWRKCGSTLDPVPFDELAAMRSIVGDELFKGFASLRGFWSRDVSRDDAARRPLRQVFRKEARSDQSDGLGHGRDAGPPTSAFPRSVSQCSKLPLGARAIANIAVLKARALAIGREIRAVAAELGATPSVGGTLQDTDFAPEPPWPSCLKAFILLEPGV